MMAIDRTSHNRPDTSCLPCNDSGNVSIFAQTAAVSASGNLKPACCASSLQSTNRPSSIACAREQIDRYGASSKMLPEVCASDAASVETGHVINAVGATSATSS